MNRPIIALLIAAALTAGTVASCGTKDGAGSSAEMPEEISLTPEESDDRAGDSIVSDDSAGEITGELSSDQIGVEGHVFTLPCAFSEWTDNGWEFADPAGTLEPNHYVHVQRFKKGDKVVFVKIYNPTSETIPYADGVITSVKVDFMYGIDSVMLPQGLLFDKNTEEEDVLAERMNEPMNKRMMALLLSAALTVGAVASCGKRSQPSRRIPLLRLGGIPQKRGSGDFDLRGQYKRRNAELRRLSLV